MRTEDPSWTDEFFGSFGVLVDDGDKVQCHVCGDWFDLLAARTPSRWKRSAGFSGPV